MDGVDREKIKKLVGQVDALGTAGPKAGGAAASTSTHGDEYERQQIKIAIERSMAEADDTAVAASSTPTASSRYQRQAYDHGARTSSCLPLPTLPLQPPHSAGHVPGCALLKQLLLTLRPFLGQRQCAGFQPACSALAAAALFRRHAVGSCSSPAIFRCYERGKKALFLVVKKSQVLESQNAP